MEQVKVAKKVPAITKIITALGLGHILQVNA